MKKALIAGVVSASLFAASAAQAESSIACMYMLLRVYHAELDYCRVALPKDREDRYSRMRTGMEQFIRANAKNSPEGMIKGVEDNNIKRALAGLKSCRSDDFSLARQAMDQLTTPENETMVRETLKIPRDPQQGSCG
jgi:hypothetical protein